MANLGFVDTKGQIFHINQNPDNSVLRKKKKKDEAPAMAAVTQTVKPTQTVKSTANTVNADGYTETNKKYGDYKYQDYANKKDYKVYKKDGKSYYYNENTKQYVDMDTPTMTSAEQDKKDYEEAIKNGYKPKKTYKKDSKGNTKQVAPAKISEKVELDTSDLTKKEKEKYKKSLIKQEKQKGKEDSYVRTSGTGIDALVGAYNNQFKNPDSVISKNIIQPAENAGRIYESGKLNNELAIEWYKKMQGKENKVDEIQRKIDNYNKFNQDVASGDVGFLGNTIQNLNTQVESLKNQGIATTLSSLAGAAGGAALGLKSGDVAGSALKGAKLGAKLGYTWDSTPYMYQLEAGNTYKDLKEMGVSDSKAKNVSNAVGAINAAIESGENIIDLISFSGAGKIAGQGLKNTAANQMKDQFDEIVENLGQEEAKKYIQKLYGKEVADQVLKSYAQNLISEGLEEGSQETVGILGERYATGSEGIKRDASLSDDLQRIGQASLAGAGSAVVLGLPTMTTGNLTSYAGTIFNNQINQNNQVAMTKVQNMNDVERNALTEITMKRKQGIPLDENDMATINYLNNRDNVVTDQNVPLNQNVQQTQENRFTYEPSDNAKINNFRQSASQFMNNSQQTQDFVNTVEKVINDKNYNITFDNTIGDDVNGRIRMNNGEVEIKINPNSERAGEFILTHEITHGIETKEMSNLIMDYASKNSEFNNALQSLKESYGTEDITPEVVADISGQMFGDEAFITNLSTTKPNVFKTIYDKIISLANKITGNSNEALFVKDLKNKWEKAYREANIETARENLGNETKLSKEQNNEIRKTKPLTKAQQKAFDKTNNNEKLTEKEFYRLYSAHKIYNTENAQNIINAIKEEGFKGDGGFGVNLVPSNITYNKENGEPLFMSDRQYAPRKGEYVLLVPESEVDESGGGYRVRQGYKPRDFEVVKVDRDFQPYYELYEKAFDKYINKELDNSSVSMKENNDIRDRAKNEIGTTTNLNEAGYLTDDGEYLDFSGKRQGARGGQRQMDHREISDIYSDNEYDAAEKKYSNMGSATAILQDFISRGNIRLNGTGVEIATAPTQQQYDKLYDYLEHVQRDNGEVFIDLDTESNNRENLEYTDKTSISKMIKDIKNHYADIGKVENNQITQDNQGRTLSKNQQEYFKDSKVVDENGNLMEVYHGTNQDFNIFESNKIGDNTHNEGMFGKGHYFTNNYDLAEGYSKYREGNQQVKKGYLNLTNPFMWNNIKTKEQMNQFIEDNNIPEGVLKWNRYEQQIHTITENENSRALTKALQENGYDGVIYEYRAQDENHKPTQEIVAFESNQFKNIDNLNPTTNDDIRYSKENKQWREYLEKNFKNEGKKTYFKDTRMSMADVGTKKGTSNSSLNNEVKKISRFKNLTALDEARLNEIFDIQRKGGELSQSQIEELEYFKRKEQGLKFPELTKSDQVNKTDYAKYYAKANLNNFDSTMLNKAKEIVQANKQGRRTKQQWLDVAENIGNQASNMDAENLKRYAYESFKEAKPNQTENLNRQGEKYVKFGVQEWVNAVYDGAGVGTKNIAEKKADSVITVRNNKGQELKLKQDKTNPNVYEKEVKIPKDNKSIVPKETMQKQLAKLKDGTKVSNFYSNLTENSKFITQENASKLSQEEIWRYAPQTNKETMANAEAIIGDTQKSLESAYGDFLSKNENFSPEDVGVGWILLKRFQDAGNYDAMVQVAKKMRNIATKSGQTVQMFNLQSRLTPEGMVKYAQSELMEAEQQFNKGKSQKEIDKYAKDFELTGEEVEFIKNQMEKIQGMEDGRAKNIEMAKINKMLSDKLPHQRGDSVKAWMRMSMLFNPKTQVRNVVGNALITPINALADVPASIADKAISKKTGTRTIGAPSLSGLATYGKGFAKGGVEAWQDYRMGLDTKDVDMSRFDITQKNPFVTDHKGAARVLNPISKGLNKANAFLDLVMSGGDRVFYQGAFDASLRNQMELNNVDTPTQDMIDIATQEALARTWNDNNGYTQFVLNTRRALNKASIGGYGLGDVLIPFAKTPANLTKAIYDYSPVGLTTTLFKTKSINNAIETGQITAQMQHDFAQNLGKGVAGTMLYAMAYALAKAGIATGSSDDDKDVANFIKNTMGIQPYSIKIGDKSFTYDWAQPVAAPIAIASDAYQNLTRDSDEDTATRVFNTILDVSNTGFNVLMQQSFLQGISEVLNSNEGVANGIIEQVIGLPARAVPTFVQQINNMFDKTQRVAFEKNQPLKTGKQNVMSKLPGQSQRLAPRVDALGNEVQRYGDSESDLTYALKNFLSPANQSNRKTSKAASEIYEVYEATGDKTIMPMVAPYYIQNKTVGRIDLDSKDRATYQKISGKLINDAVVELTNDDDYNKLSYDEKAEVLNGVVSYANAKAKEHFTGFMANTYNPANKKINNGMSIADYYLEKTMNKR